MQAFQDQTTIGWDQFLHGRIGKKWSVAYGILSVNRAAGSLLITSWAKQVVKLLWGYSISLWKFRNGEVYGHTAEEEKGKERARLL